MHHRLKALLIQARGHKVERVSGRALLPDESEMMLSNAPLVTDRLTGERSVRWGQQIWPVIECNGTDGNYLVRLGLPGEDL